MKRPRKCGTRRHNRVAQPEYWSWVRMMRRCYEPKYKGFERYGGRGIAVCKEWQDEYLNFLRDMGRKPSPNHSLDRIDNDGNYEPKNCRWATNQQQRANRRTSHRITFRGRTLCIAEWAREIGMTQSGLKGRLEKFPVEKALTMQKFKRAS